MNITTLGTFDLFHRGHMNLLKLCFELSNGAPIVVGLNTDEFVEQYKGKKPIMSFQERRQTLLEYDDFNDLLVCANDQEFGDVKGLLIDADTDLIVIGSDWARKDYVGQLGLDWDWLDEVGIGICYVNYTDGISTTEIKKRINEK